RSPDHRAASSAPKPSHYTADWLGITPVTVVPAHSASKTRVNALMLGTHIPEAAVMGPRLPGPRDVTVSGGPSRGRRVRVDIRLSKSRTWKGGTAPRR